MNLQILVGRLGQDPELKTTPSGKSVVKLCVATSHHFKHHSGIWQEETTWHDVVVWDKRAEYCNKWFKKGTLVEVEGRTSKRSYKNKQDQTIYISEVVSEKINALHGMKTKEEVENVQQSAAPQDSFDGEIPF